MRQAVSRGIYDYWNELRGERAAPERGDIDPAAIRHFLSDSFIIEIDRDCAFPIRLFGSKLNALWQKDQTGKPFLELWREEDRREVAAAILTVIDGATPIVGGAKAKRRGRRATPDVCMDLEVLLLPLRHHGKTHSRLLGALSCSNPPDWFGRVEADLLELCSLRVIRQEDQRNERSARGGPGLPGAARRPPQLIVYKGGKSV
ncbi:MAG TPA: PAS domain-containing protein [Methylocystis sp.]|nr:PAS domain-containing protein [Methylocystis sp.]